MTLSCISIAILALLAFSNAFSNSFLPRLRIFDSRLHSEPIYRIGHGYDIHRLVAGNKLVIAGVYIPYATGAEAHSDGDAVYHRWVAPFSLMFSTNINFHFLLLALLMPFLVL